MVCGLLLYVGCCLLLFIVCSMVCVARVSLFVCCRSFACEVLVVSCFLFVVVLCSSLFSFLLFVRFPPALLVCCCFCLVFVVC